MAKKIFCGLFVIFCFFIFSSVDAKAQNFRPTQKAKTNFKNMVFAELEINGKKIKKFGTHLLYGKRGIVFHFAVSNPSNYRLRITNGSKYNFRLRAVNIKKGVVYSISDLKTKNGNPLILMSGRSHTFAVFGRQLPPEEEMSYILEVVVRQDA